MGDHALQKELTQVTRIALPSSPKMSATNLAVFVAALKAGLPEEASTLEASAVEVPVGTTKTEEMAFQNCNGLAQFTFQPGLTHIGFGPSKTATS